MSASRFYRDERRGNLSLWRLLHTNFISIRNDYEPQTENHTVTVCSANTESVWFY